MPIVSYSIVDSNDDGFEETGNPTLPGAWANTSIFFGTNNPPDTWYFPGWRWQGINVPQGAIINSAILKLRARNAITGTITNIHGKFAGNKVANAPQWVNVTVMPTGITQTTAKLDYDPTVWVVDDYYNIDITSIIQEIISQGAWVALNALAITLFDDGSLIPNNIRFYDFLDGDTEASKLTIDYSSGGGGQLPFVTVIGAKRI